MLIVGAGFSGAVVARVLADNGKRVTVIDQRGHVGGNAYDYVNADGLLVHAYGPHAFHTNSDRIVEFLSRFTTWRPYELRARAWVDDKLVPVPVNATTLKMLYGADDPAGYLALVRCSRSVQTSEDVVLNAVGTGLCDTFFRYYTRKQWGLDLSDLDPSVAARIPTRTNTDDRYFTDTFQALPADGYTAMFEKMLDHKNITLRLNEPYEEHVGPMVWTGPIDQFYQHCYGPLPYRSLRFEHWTAPVERVSPYGFISYPDMDHAYTRITEFKNMTGQTHAKTALCAEYPEAEGAPYYPIPRPANKALYDRYAALARAQDYVTFVGRLAQYRYYNMDQAVAAAMTAAGRLLA